MKNKIRDFILKTIAVIFSILFANVLFNTIFFNKTIEINYLLKETRLKLLKNWLMICLAMSVERWLAMKTQMINF